MAGGFDPATYDQVDVRLQKFWGDHPDGAINTLLLSNPNEADQVVFRAEAFFERTDPMPAGVGHAFGASNLGGLADKKAWLENGETSAIGRALANCGYKAKIDSPRPSREEMEKAGAFDGGQVPTFQNNGYQRTGAQPLVRAIEEDGEEFEGPFARSTKTAELVTFAQRHGFSGTSARALRDEVQQTYKVKIKGTAPDGGALPCDIANALHYYVGKANNAPVAEAELEDVPFD